MAQRQVRTAPDGHNQQRRHIADVVADGFTTLLLVLAAFSSFWGAMVGGDDQIKWVSYAIGLIAAEIIVERVVLSRRLMSFVREGEQSIRDIDARTRATDEIMQRVVMPHFESDGSHRVFQRLKLSWYDRAKPSDGGDTIEVGPEHSLKLWQDCVLKSSTWDALSFARDLWLPHEQRVSDLTQELHAWTTGSIRRVFVVEGENELDDLMQIIRAQAERFDVRWIDRERLEQLRDQRSVATQDRPLSDLDFAVADSSFVLEFILDGKQLRASRLTKKREVVRAARRLFDLAFQAGHEIALDRARRGSAGSGGSAPGGSAAAAPQPPRRAARPARSADPEGDTPRG